MFPPKVFDRAHVVLYSDAPSLVLVERTRYWRCQTVTCTRVRSGDDVDVLGNEKTLPQPASISHAAKVDVVDGHSGNP